MIKWILHRLLRRFERQFDYDAAYMHEITDISPAATLRSLALPLMTQMRGPAPEIWAGAALASVLDGDCGPCAQLVIDDAVHSDIDPNLLQACLARDFQAAGAAGLGYRFAEAAIKGDPDADDLRAEIIRDHGAEAVLAAAYAAATCRAYPVLKRALGHGGSCQVLRISDRTVEIARRAA